MDDREKKASGSERRKYKRIEVGMRLSYKLKGEEGPPVEIESVDISAGGMCVWLNRILKLQTVLELTLAMEGADQFTCDSVLVRQDLSPRKGPDGKYRYLSGLEFCELNFVERLKLIYFCHGKDKEEKKD